MREDIKRGMQDLVSKGFCGMFLSGGRTVTKHVSASAIEEQKMEVSIRNDFRKFPSPDFFSRKIFIVCLHRMYYAQMSPPKSFDLTKFNFRPHKRFFLKK